MKKVRMTAREKAKEHYRQELSGFSDPKVRKGIMWREHRFGKALRSSLQDRRKNKKIDKNSPEEIRKRHAR